MLVLHGAWLKGNTVGATPYLFIWAEDSERWEKHGESKSNIAANRLSAHPFTAQAMDLQAVFGSASGDEWRGMGMVSDMVAFLPSDERGPRPSPRLGAEQSIVTEQQILRPWKLVGLYFPPAEAAKVLGLASRLILENKQLVFSSDFLYWLKVFDWVRQLIVAKQYLPSVVKETYGKQAWYRPMWQPYLADATEAIEACVQAMPDSACHVFPCSYPSNVYVQPDKQSLVLNFLSVLLHTVIRSALADFPAPVAREDASVIEVWLDRLIHGSSYSLPMLRQVTERLYLDLVYWQTNAVAGPAEASAFRLCLRMEEPSEPDGSWRLAYLVHPADDPSLLLPAEAVWTAEGDSFIYLQHQLPNLQQKLLRDLSYAAQFFAPIGVSLAEPCPTGCDITIQDACAFLEKAAADLRGVGIGVVVPNWWRKDQAILSARLRVADLPDGPGVFGLATLASYDLELAIGDQTISREELETIVALKMPLVKIAGKWREFSPEQAATALSFLRQHTGSSWLSLGGLLRIAASGDMEDWDEAETALPVVEVMPPNRLAEIFERLTSGQPPAITTPAGFVGTLRPYQLYGLSWLDFLGRIGLGACLADDMGLGKTIQIIAYLLCAKTRQPDTTSLIVCPTSVIDNWQREIAKFAPGLRVLLHHGADRLTAHRFIDQALEQDIVLTSYALANRDSELLSAVTWDNLITDEAQNLKNPLAQQTVAIRKIPAKNRVALTGTPVENRLSELWSIMDFLNPGYLGLLEQFKRHYAIPIERYQDTDKQRRLKQVISPFILRRMKTDKSIVSDLPEKQETKVYCSLTKEQATLYAAVLEVMLPEIEAAVAITRKALIGVTLTKLKQVCNHPAHFLQDGSALLNRSGKLTRLIEMLSELKAEGRRALIFTQYTQMGHLLKQQLEETFREPVLYLHGSLPRKTRDQIVTSFQQDPQAASFFYSFFESGRGWTQSHPS